MILSYKLPVSGPTVNQLIEMYYIIIEIETVHDVLHPFSFDRFGTVWGVHDLRYVIYHNTRIGKVKEHFIINIIGRVKSWTRFNSCFIQQPQGCSHWYWLNNWHIQNKCSEAREAIIHQYCVKIMELCPVQTEESPCYVKWGPYWGNRSWNFFLFFLGKRVLIPLSPKRKQSSVTLR